MIQLVLLLWDSNSNLFIATMHWFNLRNLWRQGEDFLDVIKYGRNSEHSVCESICCRCRKESIWIWLCTVIVGNVLKIWPMAMMHIWSSQQHFSSSRGMGKHNWIDESYQHVQLYVSHMKLVKDIVASGFPWQSMNFFVMEDIPMSEPIINQSLCLVYRLYEPFFQSI